MVFCWARPCRKNSARHTSYRSLTPPRPRVLVWCWDVLSWVFGFGIFPCWISRRFMYWYCRVSWWCTKWHSKKITGLKLLGLKNFSEFFAAVVQHEGYGAGFFVSDLLPPSGSLVSSQAFAGVGVRLVAVPKGTASGPPVLPHEVGRLEMYLAHTQAWAPVCREGLLARRWVLLVLQGFLDAVRATCAERCRPMFLL